MKNHLLACCLIFVMTINFSILAQESPPILSEEAAFQDEFNDEFGDFYGSDEFISIATGTQKSISKAPSVATVITQQQIKNLGVNNVHQIVETVTGIHVYPSNFNRMNLSYSIRGIHTRQNPQVLVLVNGAPVRANYSGAKWDLFNVGVDLIERIEVIRGPGSAVHGADAFSGVVNIVTKGFENELDSSDMGIKAGSFGTRSTWINHQFNIGSAALILNAQYEETDGDDSRIVNTDAMHLLGLGALSNAPGALQTNLETTDIHLTLKSGNFYSSLWYLDNTGGTGSGAAQALSPSDKSIHEALTLKAGYKWSVNNNLSLDISGSFQDYEGDTTFVIFPAGMALPRAVDPVTGAPTAFTVFTDGVIGRPVQKDENMSFEIAGFYSGIEDHNIRLSLGHLNKEFSAEEFKNFGPLAVDFTEDFRDGSLTNVTGTAFIYAPDVDRNVTYISLQDEWGFGNDWEVTAGIRYDNYSDFGSTFNPRIALVWQAKHNLTAKALYGRAFRAPSFDELYAINNPVILGNASLDAETINTFEVAFDYRPNFDWKLLFNIFKYNAQNLIVYTPQVDGSNLANNAAEQDGIGAEFEAHWQATDNIKLKLGYSYQNAHDALTNDAIPDAPTSSLNISLDWDLGDHYHAHFDTRWINNRNRLSSDVRDNISNYNLTNLNLIYDINQNLYASISIRNLFDENAKEPSDGQIADDFPLQKRGYWFKLAYNF